MKVSERVCHVMAQSAKIPRDLDLTCSHMTRVESTGLGDGCTAFALAVALRLSMPEVSVGSAVCTSGPGAGADLLSHECTFSDEEEAKARIAMHSTASMAGAFAARLRASRMVSTISIERVQSAMYSLAHQVHTSLETAK